MRALKKSNTINFKHIFTTDNPGRIDDFYDIEKRRLGEGSYGQVFRGKCKSTGIIRAIKQIDFTKIPDSKRFELEIAIQQQLDHPNIVKLFEVFKDAKRFYLVMELCCGGELFDRIVEEAEKHDGECAFDEAAAATYMRQIMAAMHYLHRTHFVHRDIKPENFLLANKEADAEIKVIDFGLAKTFDPETSAPMQTKAGTPYYVSPQVLAGKYDEKCDIWSCGVICYILLCGYPPFYGDKDEDILKRVKLGKFDFPSPEWDSISSKGGAKELIKMMLTYDPDSRPNAEDVLEHAWMKPRSGGTNRITADFGLNLNKFRGIGKLKKLALTLIAHNLQDSELVALKQTWQELDENKDGMLTATELRSGMLKAGVEVPGDLEELIRKVDTDGSGHIDYTEFIAATIDYRQYTQKETMWIAFRHFDKDGDGCITKAEVAEVLKQNQENPGVSEMVEKMIKEVDTNGDGSISFDEFTAMMQTPEK